MIVLPLITNGYYRVIEWYREKLCQLVDVSKPCFVLFMYLLLLQLQYFSCFFRSLLMRLHTCLCLDKITVISTTLVPHAIKMK